MSSRSDLCRDVEPDLASSEGPLKSARQVVAMKNIVYPYSSSPFYSRSVEWIHLLEIQMPADNASATINSENQI